MITKIFWLCVVTLSSGAAEPIKPVTLRAGPEQRRIGEIVYNVQRSTNFDSMKVQLGSVTPEGWLSYECKSKPRPYNPYSGGGGPGIYGFDGGSMSPARATALARQKQLAKARALNPPPEPLPPVFQRLESFECVDWTERIVLLRNVPAELDPVSGRQAMVRAMRVDTVQFGNKVYEVHDCGVPVTPVVK